MVTYETIENNIREAIESVTCIRIIDGDTSLISKDMDIAPSDFLYIFDILERKLQINVHAVLAASTYQVMTVRNLSGAIFDMGGDAWNNM